MHTLCIMHCNAHAFTYTNINTQRHVRTHTFSFLNASFLLNLTSCTKSTTNQISLPLSPMRALSFLPPLSLSPLSFSLPLSLPLPLSPCLCVCVCMRAHAHVCVCACLCMCVCDLFCLFVCLTDILFAYYFAVLDHKSLVVVVAVRYCSPLFICSFSSFSTLGSAMFICCCCCLFVGFNFCVMRFV